MQQRIIFPVLRVIIIIWLFCLLASCTTTSPRLNNASGANCSTSKKQAIYNEDTLNQKLVEQPKGDLYQLTPEERQALAVRTGLEFYVDTADTEEVQQYFAFFTHRARGTFAVWLERSELYLSAVRSILRERGLPEDLALLPYAESGYNPNAVSHAGAVGMWQFMRATGRKYGLRVDWWIDERRDPALSTQAAASYLADLHSMFGDWHLALAAYNAGEGKISRALEQTNANDFFELVDNNDRLAGHIKLKEETRNYVPKFIAISKIFQNLDLLGFQCVNWDRVPRLADVHVRGGTDLVALAQAAGMTWNQFRVCNPAYLRQVSPPGVQTMAHVPYDKQTAVVSYLKNPKSRPYAGYIVHTVRGSDSIYKISRRYGVPVAILNSMNHLISGKLKNGQQLLIPGGGSEFSLAEEEGTKKTFTNIRKLAQEHFNYVVQQNDTLWSISRRFGIYVTNIQQANGLNKDSKLSVGQRLYLPGQTKQVALQSRQEIVQYNHNEKSFKSTTTKTNSTKYTVHQGDTLYSIARRFKVSLVELLRWNELNNGSTIHSGQELKVLLQ